MRIAIASEVIVALAIFMGAVLLNQSPTIWAVIAGYIQ